MKKYKPIDLSLEASVKNFLKMGESAEAMPSEEEFTFNDLINFLIILELGNSSTKNNDNLVLKMEEKIRRYRAKKKVS